MLVITCGDTAREQLAEAGLGDECLVWRDVLHAGPVPAGLDLAALSDLRARFIAAMGWAREDAARASFAARDQALAGCTGHDEVVLWLDHNLVNQLQLVQLLDWFAGHDLDGTRLTMVDLPSFAGADAATLQAAHQARRPVTAAGLLLGRDAWAAFRSEDPTAVEAVLARDTAELPGLAPALVRHLEEFPATVDGLGRIERQALEAVASGPAGFVEVFVAQAAREERPFLGDTAFQGHLDRLAGGRAPLLEVGAGGRYRLTGAGQAVLDARADQVRLNGIDRWLGGVRLEGEEAAWRWDRDARRLRPGSA